MYAPLYINLSDSLNRFRWIENCLVLSFVTEER